MGEPGWGKGWVRFLPPAGGGAGGGWDRGCRARRGHAATRDPGQVGEDAVPGKATRRGEGQGQGPRELLPRFLAEATHLGDARARGTAVRGRRGAAGLPVPPLEANDPNRTDKNRRDVLLSRPRA